MWVRHVRKFGANIRPIWSLPANNLLSEQCGFRKKVTSVHCLRHSATDSTSKMILKFSKAVPDAFAPTKGSEKAAGYDLRSAYDYVVAPRGKEMVDTGIKIQLPEGCYGRIAPRSGLAAKNFIDVGAGVVDEDYRGLIKVILFNHSDVPFHVKKGDRIAQLICEQIYYPELQEAQELTDTHRGDGGFGSTGTN